MQKPVQHILVVGGGTAGWLAASHLARRLNTRHADGVQITLIESSEIPTIGVGEGTVPAMRNTLRDFGISETQFVRKCEVTFKQSIRFDDWLRQGSSAEPVYYHHCFDYPDLQPEDPTPYWLRGDLGGLRYADLVSLQSRLCDLGLAPKTLAHAEYEGHANYAYHLNAGLFAEMLKQHATENLGVRHVIGTVQDIEQNEQGDLRSITSADGRRLSADFFVDCTGFSARLLGERLQVPFVDKSSVLFADHAVVMQVPYADPECALPCSTLATAKPAGWIWDIGLTTRKGVGYVYSSRYTDHDRAEQCLRDYVGAAAAPLTARRIPMKIGYRAQMWKNNCVAIGLSQGFVEPLEATGLLVFDVTSRMLAELMPATRADMPQAAERFNKTVQSAWDCVIDFVKLHYGLSQRNDSEFWRDNINLASWPDSLREHLSVWSRRLPSVYDFPQLSSIFKLDNYLYVLYGMEFATDLRDMAGRYTNGEALRQRLAQQAQYLPRRLHGLPSHRELINRIKQHGLSKT